MNSEVPTYKDPPRYDSVAIFTKYVKSKSVVDSIRKVNRQILEITKSNGTCLRVFVVDTYILGEADVHEILSIDPATNCIVALSRWNSYTSAAKALCKKQRIGLFTFDEFMGAIYRDGKKFLDYVAPDDTK